MAERRLLKRTQLRSLRQTLAAPPRHLPPETAADVPTEFVSVTETVLRAVVSPLYANGIVTENAPPLATPAELWNQVVPAEAKDTVKDVVPLSVVLEAALNVSTAPLPARR